MTWDEAQVHSLDMYGANQPHLFTYSVNSSGNTQNEQFLGPRTIISRLSMATATQGEILPIRPPFPNASYALDFYGPAVQCSQPNATVMKIIHDLRLNFVQSFQGNLIEEANYYFAFVPDLSNLGNASAPDYGVGTFLSMRMQQPESASNQLWMAYTRNVSDPNGTRYTEDHYSLCQLYNASYSINLTFEEGEQTIQDTGTRILNTVDYPQLSTPYSDDLMSQHAYSAVMWALTDLLVGSMGIFTENTSATSNIPTNFSEITTQIQHTSLLGSSDLDAFFDASHYLASTNTSLSDQRLQDIALAKNHTLEILIPELCYNITLSLMSNPLLAHASPFSPPISSFIDIYSRPLILANITLTTSINTYAYHSKNLLISYALAISFALFSITLGAIAYRSNGVSHNKTFSAILTSTRDMGLTDLFHEQRLGRLPLPDEIKNTKLKFGKTRGGGLGFSRARTGHWEGTKWIEDGKGVL
jgi:hypothetical protein